MPTIKEIRPDQLSVYAAIPMKIEVQSIFRVELVDAGLDVLWVSMDGATPESYEDVRLGAELPHVLAAIQAELGTDAARLRRLGREDENSVYSCFQPKRNPPCDSSAMNIRAAPRSVRAGCFSAAGTSPAVASRRSPDRRPSLTSSAHPGPELAVARIAQAQLRNVDLAARYGGEELVFLLPRPVQLEDIALITPEDMQRMFSSDEQFFAG